MKLGAEPKKVGIFVALVVVAGIVYWMNSPSDSSPAPVAARPNADAIASGLSAPPTADGVSRSARKRIVSGRAGGLSEVIYKSPDAVDPSKVDPTLRLDLLAKVQAVNVEGGARNLFQFCPECAQKEAAKAAEEAAKKVPVVPPIHPNAAPPAVAEVKPPQPAPPPGPPPTPPITLKYYGYSTKYSDGEKKAFFLDGDDVIVAAEGEIIKKQYKIVRIGVTSVLMEDTASKSTQTLPMQQDAPV